MKTLITILSALPIYAADVRLTWDANPETDIAGYRVYWGLGSRSYTTNATSGLNLANTVSGLADSTTYYFAVTAFNTSGLESDFSNEVTVTTATPRPAPPTGVSGVPVVASLRLATNSVGWITRTAVVQVEPGATIKAQFSTASWSFGRTLVATNGFAFFTGKATQAPFTASLNVQSVTVFPGQSGRWDVTK